jgi:N,N-dimethylformamidase
MVYFAAPKNGAVFSTGSIAFGQALRIEGFDNNASKLPKNVVDAFTKSGQLPGLTCIYEEKQWR